jgi:hypothetical protein
MPLENLKMKLKSVKKPGKIANHSGRSWSWQKTPTLTLDDFQAFFEAIAP